MDNKTVVLATLEMYKDCAKDATQSLLRNLPVLAASVAAYFTYRLCIQIFGPFGMAGGFLIGLISMVLLTFYYGWLSECVRRNKLNVEDYTRLDYTLFCATMNAGFVLYLATFLIGGTTAGVPGSGPILMCIGLGIFLLFNALPEVLYLQGCGCGCADVQAFAATFRFVRDNWIEWFLPLIVLFLPILFEGPQKVLMMMSGGHPLLPVLNFTEIFAVNFKSMGLVFPSEISLLVFRLILLFVSTWFMLFRGFLFLALESGSRRQRAFRSSQR